MEGHQLVFHRANTERVTGWQATREMIRQATLERPERPGMWVFNVCREWLRTVPGLVRHPTNQDDVDTTAEDHAADETRYAAMTIVGRENVASRVRTRIGG